jgi:glycosyltransferase involved in cell wall biosynthesis
MKVAIVLNTSWNIYNFRMNFVKALIKQGHEVHTIAPLDNFTHYLTDAGCTHHNVYMDSRGANVVKDLALMFELSTIYLRIKPNVVLHYTIKPNVYGTLAAAALNIPMINNVCGLGTVFLKNGLVSSIAKLLYKIAFRFPKKVFFQNPDDMNFFINEKLVSAQIAEIVPGSGIDTSAFHPALFKKNSVFTFLLVSRLIYDKGIKEYIEAIRLLKAKGVNAKFQLLGPQDPKHKRGIPVKEIESWIKEGLVEYLGKTTDVTPFMKAADCIVLPSYREGSPRSLMEASCLAKPIVATDVPGCRQVVQDGLNGLLCKLQSAQDLAFKMETMMRLPDSTRQMMGEYGRRKMEIDFSDFTVLNKYTKAMNEIYVASLLGNSEAQSKESTVMS